MEPALQAFPAFLLGFLIVGIFFMTMLIMWGAVWRSNRAAARGAEAAAPRQPRRLTRRRIMVLAGIGAVGGALIGLAASQLASRGRSTGGRVGAEAPPP